MINSNRVDVIMAPSTDAEAHDTTGLYVDSIETVDVSPDPTARIIVVAHSKAAGAELAEAQGFTPVAVVTPRSLHAARGIPADSVVWADDITDEQRATLNPHVAPSLDTGTPS